MFQRIGVVNEVVDCIRNLVYPPICNLCHAMLLPAADGLLICDACRAGLEPPFSSWCLRCGARVQTPLAEPTSGCSRCRPFRFCFQSAWSMGDYRGPLRRAILTMKQPHQESVVLSIGRLMTRHLLADGWVDRIDCIAPMPLHWTRRISRGNNVADLLIEPIVRKTRLVSLGNLLKYLRKTRKQGTLSIAQRFANVRGALTVSSGYDISGARVLIVDDVMTSGATASEAARVCLEAGAREVHVAVVARGMSGLG